MRKKTANATVADVARVAGVGAITVSRFINGVSYVSVEKQKRIKAAIKKLGYQPNEAARVLKGHRARMIGVIIPDMADPFFSQCAAAIEAYASREGYLTMIVASERNQHQDELAMMLNQRIAGLIIVPSTQNGNFGQVSESQVPVVALERPLAGVAADEVTVENLGGALISTEHLIGHDHSKIICVGFNDNSFPIAQRIQGYMSAMRAAGLKPDVHLQINSAEAAVQFLRTWKKRLNRPTALFSLNNVSTRYLLHAIRKLAIEVPKELAIIGFDDIELASLLSPPLTVIRQPVADLGTQAAQILFDRIQSRSSSTSTFGVKLVLPVELVIRGSCGCQPG